MKNRTPYKIGIGILAIGISILLIIGIRIPPKKLSANELSSIDRVLVNNGSIHALTEREIEYWKSLEFELAKVKYPGETPDFVVNLIGINANYSAMYNKNSEIVFFSFVPEIRYGFLNAPSPGGWTGPIYETQANQKLLELLRIKYHSF